MRAAVLLGRSPAMRYSVHRGYVDGLVAVGAQPVLVPAGPGVDPGAAAEVVCSCDVVVMTGGDDVDPVRYGRQRGIGESDIDPERDAVELSAVREAHAAGRPILGICRGIQLVTVALGGSLVPDLPSAGYSGHWDLENEEVPVHSVSADPGSSALRALGGAEKVNSIHHQAVADPGPVLRASAWSDDGVIEAVEAPGVLGVQWHPERLLAGDPRHLAPFQWLVTA
jgi:putative glutamine amidotransferase